VRFTKPAAGTGIAKSGVKRQALKHGAARLILTLLLKRVRSRASR
jgi:hypothetical protein